MREKWVTEQRFAWFAAITGVVLLAAAAVSDFLIGSFWGSHSMLTSLVANLIVVIVSVAVISQWIERRRRRQWNVLAQNVMFALAQCARLTWTSMITLAQIVPAAEGEAAAATDENLALALDPQTVLPAFEKLLPGGLSLTQFEKLLLDQDRRQRLQLVVGRLSDHAAQVITNWAGVMVGASTYASLINSHVELQSRLEWLSSVMADREPPPDQDGRRRRLTRASVAVTSVAHLGDEWLRDQAAAITVLAARLDHESLDQAFSLNSPDWWSFRTDELLKRP